jgi:hypothetical protein
MVLEGYTLEKFDQGARLNFVRGIVAATASSRITEKDVYIISITDISDSLPTRKLLQYSNADWVPKLGVEFEILTLSEEEAMSFASNLESPLTVELLRAAGLPNLAGVSTQAAYVPGRDYTRKSPVDEDLEEFGFGLIGVGAFVFLALAVLYFFGLLRPTSYMGLLLVRIKGEERYRRERDFWCCTTAMKSP